MGFVDTRYWYLHLHDGDERVVSFVSISIYCVVSQKLLWGCYFILFGLGQLWITCMFSFYLKQTCYIKADLTVNWYTWLISMCSLVYLIIKYMAMYWKLSYYYYYYHYYYITSNLHSSCLFCWQLPVAKYGCVVSDCDQLREKYHMVIWT